MGITASTEFVEAHSRISAITTNWIERVLITANRFKQEKTNVTAHIKQEKQDIQLARGLRLKLWLGALALALSVDKPGLIDSPIRIN